MASDKKFNKINIIHKDGDVNIKRIRSAGREFGSFEAKSTPSTQKPVNTKYSAVAASKARERAGKEGPESGGIKVYENKSGGIDVNISDGINNINIINNNVYRDGVLIPKSNDQTVKTQSSPPQSTLPVGVTTPDSGVANAAAAQRGEIRRPNKPSPQKQLRQKQNANLNQEGQAGNDSENLNQPNTDSADNAQENTDESRGQENSQPENIKSKYKFQITMLFMLSTTEWLIRLFMSISGIIFESIGFLFDAGVITAPLGVLFNIIGGILIIWTRIQGILAMLIFEFWLKKLGSGIKSHKDKIEAFQKIKSKFNQIGRTITNPKLASKISNKSIGNLSKNFSRAMKLGKFFPLIGDIWPDYPIEALRLWRTL